MASTPIDMNRTISRYVAGHLPAEEAEAFERALSEQPDLRDATEHMLRFKEGLARLNQRGQLAALMRDPAPRRWLPYAAAAALAMVTLGGLLWLQLSSSTPVVLALSPKAFATRGREAPAILRSFILARTRGEAPGVDLEAARSPGAIELRILPSTLTTGAQYNVQVGRHGLSGNGAIVGRFNAIAPAPDGYITLYLNAQKLTRGTYDVLLALSSPDGVHAEVDRFDIRVH